MEGEITMNSTAMSQTNEGYKQEGNQVEDGIFKAQLDLQKAEQYVKKYLMNNEVAKEYREENSMLKEDVGHLIGKTEAPRVFELEDGHFAVIKVIEKSKDVLDKEALALHLGIDKDELKTPLDFVMLTKQGKLMPETIKAFMFPKPTLQVSIRKTKSNPLKRKKNKFQNNEMA